MLKCIQPTDSVLLDDISRDAVVSSGKKKVETTSVFKLFELDLAVSNTTKIILNVFLIIFAILLPSKLN